MKASENKPSIAIKDFDKKKYKEYYERDVKKCLESDINCLKRQLRSNYRLIVISFLVFVISFLVCIFFGFKCYDEYMKTSVTSSVLLACAIFSGLFALVSLLFALFFAFLKECREDRTLEKNFLKTYENNFEKYEQCRYQTHNKYKYFIKNYICENDGKNILELKLLPHRNPSYLNVVFKYKKGFFVKALRVPFKVFTKTDVSSVVVDPPKKRIYVPYKTSIKDLFDSTIDLSIS